MNVTSTTNNNHLWLVAGEVSGDMHAAGLVHQLKQQIPDLVISGVGGPALQKTGMHIYHHINELAVMGFSDVVKALPRIYGIFRNCVRLLKKDTPQAVILVDFPDFNLLFARKAWKLGIPVIYYISPQLWAWRRRRIKKIKKYIHKMIVIFPFEEEFYRKNGVDVCFSGYPLCEEIANKSFTEGESAINDEDLDNKYVVGLLPGSRNSEVKKILPHMLDGMAKLNKKYPDTLFLLPKASTVDRQIIDDISKNYMLPLTVVDGETYKVMTISDFIVVASGTATVEATCLTEPMIVVYRISPFNYAIARSLIRVDHIAMTNLVAGYRLVPELIQNEMTGERIFQEADILIQNPERLDKMHSELAIVRNRLQSKSAYEKAARQILKVIQGES